MLNLSLYLHCVLALLFFKHAVLAFPGDPMITVLQFTVFRCLPCPRSHGYNLYMHACWKVYRMSPSGSTSGVLQLNQLT